jgi:subtilisin family serine protease
VLASLAQYGVRALLRETNVKQVNGESRGIQYRFTYLLNGFVAYVAAADIERLRAHPEVSNVSEPQQATFHLDRAIDYSLGTQTNPADRRNGRCMARRKSSARSTPARTRRRPPENRRFEGQGLNIAIIDSGVDYRHPMFGGTGNNTPLPRVSGANETPNDNKKVIYFYTFNEPLVIRPMTSATARSSLQMPPVTVWTGVRLRVSDSALAVMAPVSGRRRTTRN